MLVKEEKEMSDLVRRSRKAMKVLVTMADKSSLKYKVSYASNWQMFYLTIVLSTYCIYLLKLEKLYPE